MRLSLVVCAMSLLACSSPSAPAATTTTGSDSGASTDTAPAKECPPAPLRDVPTSCEGALHCNYGPSVTKCNSSFLDCRDGKFARSQELAECFPKAEAARTCANDFVDGASCTFHEGAYPYSNVECFRATGPHDAAKGETPGEACACDKPGPRVRCVPTTFKI